MENLSNSSNFTINEAPLLPQLPPPENTSLKQPNNESRTKKPIDASFPIITPKSKHPLQLPKSHQQLNCTIQPIVVTQSRAYVSNHIGIPPPNLRDSDNTPPLQDNVFFQLSNLYEMYLHYPSNNSGPTSVGSTSWEES